MGNGPDAAETYAELAASLANSPDLEVSKTLSLSLVTQSNLLITIGRSDEAVDVFDEALNRFGSRPEPEIFFNVAGAALGKADALVSLGEIGEAIFIYEAVVVEAGTKNEVAFEGLQVSALLSKGRAQQVAGALDDAAATFNFVLDAWIGNPDGTITQLVSSALNARNEIADILGVEGVPGSCLILEEGDCVIRDRFPTRPNVQSPFLPHIVAFNLTPGTPVYVPYASDVVGPEFIEGTREVIVTFAVAPTEEVPENRCTVQFVSEGTPAITAGPADAGTLVGTIADDRLSGPATTGFIYNLTISCLFRDPQSPSGSLTPDLALIDQLFGSLPPG